MILLVYCAPNYNIVGEVENVIYVPLKQWPYVALGSSESRQYFYHAAYQVDQCGFAERAKHFGYTVKIYEEISSGNNNLLAIEYADTNAKFWYSVFWWNKLY